MIDLIFTPASKVGVFLYLYFRKSFIIMEKALVKAKINFLDRELKCIVSQGQVLKVSTNRAAYLITNGFADIVKDGGSTEKKAVSPVKKQTVSPAKKTVKKTVKRSK